VDAVDDPELLDLVELEVRELLRPIVSRDDVAGGFVLSALGPLNGEEKCGDAD